MSISKTNFCSRVLRLSVLPSCRERPQTTICCCMIAQIKVSGDWFRCVFVVFLYDAKVFSESVAYTVVVSLFH